MDRPKMPEPICYGRDPRGLCIGFSAAQVRDYGDQCVEFGRASVVVTEEMVERVARAIAVADHWEGWDSAKTFADTPIGNDAEECRECYRDLARAALTAALGGGE